MNVFDLAAKITLDTSGYTDGLKTVAKVGAAALGATGAALFTFGKKSVDTGKEFDSSMSQIAATLGYTTDDIKNNVNGAGDAFASLRTKAKEMGAETNFSASEAADGLNILAMSGYDAEQSMSMIEDVLHLAAAGSMDMGSAAKFVSGTMKGFNDATKDSGYYADLMAKGATLANTSVSQLGEAMSSGAATSAAYSQSADSMTIALLRLAEQGEVGSAAGTALAAAMKNLYTPTDQAATALKTLGVAVYDESGNARDFNTVVDELEASFAGMTEEQKNAYKQTIFGIQGLNAYNKMVVTGKKKQDDWNKSLRAASEGAGEAAKQYDTMTDNLEGDIDILKSAADGFKIEVSDKLMPSIREFVQFGSESISNFTKAFSQGGLNGLAKAVGDALSNLIKRVSQKLPDFVKAGVSLVRSFLGGIIDSLPELAQSGLEMILELGRSIGDALPELIPKAAEAVVTVVRGLAKNSSKLIQGATEIFKGLAQGLIAAVPTIIDAIPGIIQDLVASIGENFDAFLPAIGLLGGKKLLGGIVSGMKDSSLLGELKETMGGKGSIVAAVIGGVVLLMEGANKEIRAAYATAKEEASKLTESQQAVIDKAREEAEKWAEIKEKRQETAKGIDETVGKYKDLWDRLTEIVDEQGNIKKGYEEEAKMITGELSEALGIEIGIVDGQIQKYGELKGSIDEVITKKKAELMLKAFEEDYTEAIKKRTDARTRLTTAEGELTSALDEQKKAEQEVTAAQNRLNEAKAYGAGYTTLYGKSMVELETELAEAQGKLDGATEKVDALSEAVSDSKTDLKEAAATMTNYDDVVSAVASGSVSDMNRALDVMTNSIKTAKNATKEELMAQTKAFRDEYKKQTEAVKSGGGAAAKEAQAEAKRLLNLSISELAKLDDKTASEIKAAIRAANGLSPKWFEIGKQSASGIARGFSKSAYLVVNAAKEGVSSAIYAAKKKALIASPSKLFRDEVGFMMGKGLALGMEDAEDIVRRASEGLIESADDFDDEGFDVQAVDTGEQAPGGITINVYGAEGQDVNTLADEVAARLQRMYRKEVARFA